MSWLVDTRPIGWFRLRHEVDWPTQAGLYLINSQQNLVGGGGGIIRQMKNIMLQKKYSNGPLSPPPAHPSLPPTPLGQKETIHHRQKLKLFEPADWDWRFRRWTEKASSFMYARTK